MKSSIKIFVFFIVSSIYNKTDAQNIKRTVHETLISRMGSYNVINNTYTVSNNLRRIAFCIRKENKTVAVIDTLEGKGYEEVSTPVFSADGKRFAYAAKDDARWNIIVDHKPQAALAPGTAVTLVTFSPDSKKLLYITQNENHAVLFFDQKKSKTYDSINENSIAFSSNGKIAFTAIMKQKQFNVVDEEEGPSYDKVGFPVFSVDGKQFAYWAISGKKYFVVTNNNKSIPYDFVGDLLFSADGKHFLYDAKQNGKHFVVLDGVAREKYNEITSYTLKPDGSALAYAITEPPKAEEEFTAYVVFNGEKQGPYEQVMSHSLQFSPDGKELIYGAGLPLDTIINGVKTELPVYEWFLVRNGKNQPRYNMLQGSMTFSPDGRHFSYGAEKYLKRVVNLDGKELAPYDDIYFVGFTSDSKHLVYSAKLNHKEFVVVDGKEGKMFDELQGQKTIMFDSNNSFHYLAKKGNNIYIVEEKIE